MIPASGRALSGDRPQLEKTRVAVKICFLVLFFSSSRACWPEKGLTDGSGAENQEKCVHDGKVYHRPRRGVESLWLSPVPRHQPHFAQPGQVPAFNCGGVQTTTPVVVNFLVLPSGALATTLTHFRRLRRRTQGCQAHARLAEVQECHAAGVVTVPQGL